MLSKIEISEFPSIYPPRPSSAIDPLTIAKYRGYIAQFKYDDIRILIYFHPDGEIRLLNRKREPLLSYQLDAQMRKRLQSLDLRRGSHHLLDGGLLRHAMPTSGRKPIVLWDILIHDNSYLLGTGYLERYELLKTILRTPTELEQESGKNLGLKVAPGLWLAPIFRDHLDERFSRTERTDILEGLILKNPRAPLDWGVREENNGAWQIRVRKQSGRHVF